MARIISFENISFGYNKNSPLFKELSFSIKQPDDNGYIVGLMGDSGSGKSTLLKLLLGTERIWSGNIDIQPAKPIISYVPQEPILFEHLTPLENAMFFGKTKRFKKSFNQDLYDQMEDRLNMRKLLKSAKSINEISGGQKQRISLLRALSIKPDILLLDEPLTGLDERVKYHFLVDLAMAAQTWNILMIYITHYRQEIELISDEIVYLKKDKESDCINEIIQEKTADFFHKPPTLSALYLSKAYGTNILPIEIDSNGRVSLYKKGNRKKTDFYHISFHHNTIQFDNDLGWEFVEIVDTGSYLYLQLTENDAIIILPKDRRGDLNGMNRIFLKGNVDIYINENHSQSKTINNNIIDSI